MRAQPEDFVGMNQAYAEFFPSNRPARAVAKSVECAKGIDIRRAVSLA